MMITMLVLLMFIGLGALGIAAIQDAFEPLKRHIYPHYLSVRNILTEKKPVMIFSRKYSA
ncbi:hypothetical protein [Kordiimonas sp. SCSIO 12610]|uniref:hypothetical protein n=1 Tax=Kordiimonas sp. SCSIO 12610 TaxID=2829597 RepID=UPI00210E2A93|nr:hypothetical protein [Kordiimonas sp. SCSIO 12610]UTW53804.1 hypothetical protein KFF44_08075 [Kordiimonas sp. SCSIO 12610]